MDLNQWLMFLDGCDKKNLVDDGKRAKQIISMITTDYLKTLTSEIKNKDYTKVPSKTSEK